MGVKGHHSAHDEYLTKSRNWTLSLQEKHGGNKGRTTDHVTSVKKANLCLY